jgi:hypothetical protein
MATFKGSLRPKLRGQQAITHSLGLVIQQTLRLDNSDLRGDELACFGRELHAGFGREAVVGACVLMDPCFAYGRHISRSKQL